MERFVISNLAAIVVGSLLVQPAQAITFSDDFESYASGSNLAGQGGWVQSDTSIAPMIVSGGGGLGSNVADGTIRTGDGSYTGNSISIVSHSLDGLFGRGKITNLSFDAFATTANRSHSAGTLLASHDLGVQVGWYADWYDSVDREQPKWQFYTPSGVEVIHGGFDERVHFGITADGRRNTVAGSLTYSGGTILTAEYGLTDEQFSSLTAVSLLQDFRDIYLGVEIDNISVTASSTPFAKVISGNSDAYVVNVSGTTVAVPNLQLNVGNQIITGPAGSASIFLTDGEDTAELSLAENTSVTISDLLDLLVDETVGRVDHAVDCLRQGSACFRTRSRPPHPSAIVTIRGTKFSIFGDGFGGSILEVSEGTVETTDSLGVIHLIPAGNSFSLQSAPVPLPPSGVMLGTVVGILALYRRRILS